jgi:hypothetical protein
MCNITLPLVTTALKMLQPSRVKPGIPSNFDRDRAQGHTFLMSTFHSQHWALSMSKCASIWPYPTSRVDMQ